MSGCHGIAPDCEKNVCSMRKLLAPACRRRVGPPSQPGVEIRNFKNDRKNILALHSIHASPQISIIKATRNIIKQQRFIKHIINDTGQ